MSNSYPTLTINQTTLPEVEHFIQKTAQLALQLEMIKMTGVGDSVTITLLPAKVLMIEIPLDNGNLRVTTDLVRNVDTYISPFTLSTDDAKAVVGGAVSYHMQRPGPTKDISDLIKILTGVFVDSRDEEIGTLPKLIIIDGPQVGYPPYPEMQMPYGFQPQQSQQPYGFQPQQPQNGYPMGHEPVGAGYYRSRSDGAPIKQGYMRDDETGVEGRNERPGG